MMLTTNMLTTIVLNTGGKTEVIRQFGPLLLANSPCSFTKLLPSKTARDASQGCTSGHPQIGSDPLI
jgi:hypothetical protein